MPDCRNVRTPGRAASRRYGPTGRFVNTYDPVSFVTTLRLEPAAVCVAVTSTPGNTAPLGSFTVPLSWAVDCAKRTLDKHPTNQAMQIRRFMVPPPLPRKLIFLNLRPGCIFRPHTRCFL